MPQKKVILVTGVADYWGAKLATRLLKEADIHVIGLDNQLPKMVIPGLDFIQADIRNRALVDLFQAEQVDTVCHLNFKSTIKPNERAFQTNVMGTSNLFGACREAAVRKIILKSSILVYGAQFNNSAFLSEDSPLQATRNYGYTRHWLEIENLCRKLNRQSPDTILTVLRFGHIIGPTASTPITQFLSQPLPLTLTGFNPMMQFIHEDDVIEALVHATLNDTSATINVATEDSMPLQKIISLVGKISLPIFHPLAYFGVNLLNRQKTKDNYAFPIEPDYLRYRVVGDLNKMHNIFHFSPQYSAEETLQAFANRPSKKDISAETIARNTESAALQKVIAHRQQLKNIKTT